MWNRSVAFPFLYIGTAIGAVLFIYVGGAEAARSIAISEVMWDGVEYVELVNPTDETISLANWSLVRQKEGGEIKTIIVFSEGHSVSAGGYFLIEKNETATSEVADAIASGLTLLNTGERLELLNENEEVVDEVNELGPWFAGENTTTGVAMERTDIALDGTSAAAWHTSTGESGGRFGTPKQENSEPHVNTPPEAEISAPDEALVGEEVLISAEDSSDEDDDALTFTWNLGDGTTATGEAFEYVYTTAGSYTIVVTVSDGEAEVEREHEIVIEQPVYSDDIWLSEFVPNPAGSDTDGEFIELYNNSEQEVDISGWQLDDASGGSAPYTFPDGTTIGIDEYQAWYRSDTKLALNNSGDSVRLLDPSGALKDNVSYDETVDEGIALVLLETEIAWSTTPTPGEENIITDPLFEDDEVTDDEEAVEGGSVAGGEAVAVVLADIRDEEVGTVVTTTGVVSVPPGTHSDRELYLYGSGIQVYFSAADWPDISLGDTVELTGELSNNRGEARLKLASAESITVTASGDPPEPHVMETGDIDEAMEGSLVTVQGFVTQTSGDTFYLDDESGEVKIYIKEATGIEKPKMKKGDAVTITGVVSETSSGYRILPRWQEDVRLGLVAGLTSFPATGIVQGWSHELFFLLWGIVGCLFLLAGRAHEPLMRW